LNAGVCMKPSVYGKRQLSEIIKLPRWNTSQTRRVIKALEDSGMSVAKFCGLHGLNYWRVMNAKRRLGSKAVSRLARKSDPAFVPIMIEGKTVVENADEGEQECRRFCRPHRPSRRWTGRSFRFRR
jgi:hypothetical protein